MSDRPERLTEDPIPPRRPTRGPSRLLVALLCLLAAVALGGCAPLPFGESQTLVIYVPTVPSGAQPTLEEVARLVEVPPTCFLRIHVSPGWYAPATPLPPRTGLLLPIGGIVPEGWSSSAYQGPQQQCDEDEWTRWYEEQRAIGQMPASRLNRYLLQFAPLQEEDPIFLHLPLAARRWLRIVLGGGLLLVWFGTVITFLFIQIPHQGPDARTYREVVSDYGPVIGSILWVLAMLATAALASAGLSFLAHFVATRRTSFGGSGRLFYVIIFAIVAVMALLLALISRFFPAYFALVVAAYRAIAAQGDRLFLVGYLIAGLVVLLAAFDRFEDYSGNAALCLLSGAVCMLWGWVPFLPPPFPQISPFTGFLLWTILGAMIFALEATEQQAHVAWRKDPLLLALTVAILTLGLVAQYGRGLLGMG